MIRAPNNFLQRRLLLSRHTRSLLRILKGGIVENMLGRVIAFISVVATVLLLIIWRFTAPTTIGPLGILVVFILMYTLALGVLTFFLLGINRLIIRIFPSRKKGGVSTEPMTVNRAYYFASVIALAPVMFIGMQSVSEVGVYELILITLFVGIGCVYIAKRTN